MDMADITHSEARQMIQAAAVGHLRLIDRAACNQHVARCQPCQAYAADLGALQTVLTRTLQPRVLYREQVKPQSLPVAEMAAPYEVQNRPVRFSAWQTAAWIVLIVVMLAGANWLLQGRLAPAAPESPAGVPTQPAPLPTVITLAEAAQLEYVNGHLSKAIGLYQKIADAAPQNIAHQIELARIQVYAGNVVDGIATARRAILLDPNNSDAHAVLALGLDWNGELDAASDEAVRAIQLDPQNAQAYAYYADVLLDQNRDTLAGDAAQQALKLDPNNVAARGAYGSYLNSTNNHEPARRALSEALALEPANADLHGRLGLVYFRSLDYEKAVIELDCVVKGCTPQVVTSSPTSPYLVVEGLPLNPRTLQYYYVYSSVLSALSTPNLNTCQQASLVNQKLRAYVAQHSEDNFVLDIVHENESICNLAVQPALRCGPGWSQCNEAINQAQQDLGFQIRLPSTLLREYILTNFGYDIGFRRVSAVFVREGAPLDSLIFFQGALNPGGGINWDITRFYSADVLVPVQIGPSTGYYLPGVAGQNPTDSNDQMQELYWQADSLEYLISRKIPLDDDQNHFIALAQEMMAQPASLPVATTLAQAAQQQYAMGYLSKAVGLYQQIADANPQDITHQIELARVQVYAGYVDDGIATAHKAIQLDANNSDAHAVLALGLDWNGKLDSASDEAAQAIQLDPQNGLAYAIYAEILVDQQRWSQARDAAQQALKFGPQTMEAHWANAYYQESIGEYALAVEEYKAALKIEPNLPFLLIRLEDNYWSLGRSDEAADVTQQVQEIGPDNVVLYPRGVSYRTIPAGVIPHLEELLALDPANADLRGRLGLAYFKTLDYEKAIIELGCVVDGCQVPVTSSPNQDVTARKTVVPLPLSDKTSEYYYTYSSVLTALSTPANDTCQRAKSLNNEMEVFATKNPKAGIDLDILAENEAICDRAHSATPQPSLTPTP